MGVIKYVKLFYLELGVDKLKLKYSNFKQKSKAFQFFQFNFENIIN